ncbi:putative signal transducing protein [Chryseobacterium koreense]|uniref:DUF2007 domain-containing protein n=1 Tax=Chryseobacterium koreense CCUG 49689 TaxID=1304281 RepID=A0A0J7J332_9FLAO|nr:DUF2007 domain-containing protein [Chryseobacterium koreense]KMQ72622.1 hypothetical protein ACM44_00545 [Chryseobacterium koreense CCUG 49689]MBB5333013.1 hypothetical protein [Chryseobacterium koreense]
MSELVILLQSSYLYEIEIAKSKLASRDIPSYVKNEFVNNVAVFPMSQNYVLVVSENDLEEAKKILEEDDSVDESEML